MDFGVFGIIFNAVFGHGLLWDSLSQTFLAEWKHDNRYLPNPGVGRIFSLSEGLVF